MNVDEKKQLKNELRGCKARMTALDNRIKGLLKTIDEKDSKIVELENRPKNDDSEAIRYKKLYLKLKRK